MISLGGYTQARYYRLLETNPNLGCEQCYKSCGADNGWFLRRGRLRFSGYVTKRIFLYIQPDFASGRGPGYNPALNTSEESNLNGGNVLAHLWDKIKGHALAPFV